MREFNTTLLIVVCALSRQLSGALIDFNDGGVHSIDTDIYLVDRWSGYAKTKEILLCKAEVESKRFAGIFRPISKVG